MSKRCPRCGSEKASEATYCADCGIWLGDAAASGETQYTPPEMSEYQPHGFPPHQPGHPRYAGFWIRFAAVLIDGIILYVIYFPLNLVIWVIDANNSIWGGWAHGEAGFQILVTWAYFIILTGRYGATLGKMALRLQVVEEGIQPISYGTAALRETVGKFISGIAIALGFIWAGFDDRKQAWHDKVARTFVVRKN